MGEGHLEAEQAAKSAYEQGLRDARDREIAYDEVPTEREMSTGEKLGMLLILLITASTVASFYWGYNKIPNSWWTIGKISLVIALNTFAWMILGGILLSIINLIKKEEQHLDLLLCGLIGISITGTCVLSFTKCFSYLPQNWGAFTKVIVILGINIFSWQALGGAISCLINALRKKEFDFELVIFGLSGIGFIITTILSFEKITFNFPMHWWRIAKIPVVIGANLFGWLIISCFFYYILLGNKPAKIDWDALLFGVSGLGFVCTVTLCFDWFVPSSLGLFNVILRTSGIIAGNLVWWAVLGGVTSSLLNKRQD
ncbi:MAG: hypothetical protein WC374_11035 [Phycisphaerae bacterium]|jgi:hypothetical protein